MTLRAAAFAFFMILLYNPIRHRRFAGVGVSKPHYRRLKQTKNPARRAGGRMEYIEYAAQFL
jgi:hypothetical protein